MAKLPWTPWHEVVTLRDDLKTGELSLQMFVSISPRHTVVRRGLEVEPTDHPDLRPLRHAALFA